MVRFALVMLVVLASPALADPVATVEGSFVSGFPAALPTGLSRGLGAAIATATCPVRWGARVAWVTATESTMAWEVTHSDLQLRATVGAQHYAGRGRFGLRLGVGGTLVRETRLRSQGARAGLEGDELEQTALAMLPAADLEAVIGVTVDGPWSLAMSGGPSFVYLDGDVRTSWIAQLGIGWNL